MRWLPRFLPFDARPSYAQCGEDIIVDFVLQGLGVQAPSYLDIGAFHPTRMSNTFLFYERGCSGVCLEPDPDACAAIKRKRPRDSCLAAGVGVNNQKSAPFWVLNPPSLSTFSQADVDRLREANAAAVVRMVEVPLLRMNDILRDYFLTCPHFVSLDVEGFELPVLETIDFDTHRPLALCVETLTFSPSREEVKINAVADFLRGKGYLPYADTYINTIFVEEGAWKNR